MTTAAPPQASAASDGGRARLPDRSDTATSADGVRITFDVFGDATPTLVLLPSAPIVHSRQWKAQVPYLARHFRVVTFDGRGNGRSDRPTDPEAFAIPRLVDDLRAVLDASETRTAVLVTLCMDGLWPSIELAAAEPERVAGIVAFSVGVPFLTPPHPHWKANPFDGELTTDEGWAKHNAHYWRRDYRGWVEFFFGECLPEPHSTKPLEDIVGWAMDGSLDVMLAEAGAPIDRDRATMEAICRSVTRPMLLVHGTADQCQPIARGRRLAELTGAPLVEVAGAGHLIPARHPVLANLLIRDFVRSLEEAAPWRH
jgi:pimeloyl-ACP methyl ester carboxylesterase